MPDIPQDSAADAKAWVQANQPVIDAAYQVFLESGEWPQVADLQRHFDRTGDTTDIQAIVNAKPHVLSEARMFSPDRLTLEMRHLMWVPNARPLVNICVTAVQRAVDAYLSDESEPIVSSEDGLTAFPSDRSGGLRKHAYDVLTRENPSPFGGSIMNDEDHWRINVDARFRGGFETCGRLRTMSPARTRSAATSLGRRRLCRIHSRRPASITRSNNLAARINPMRPRA